MPEATPPDADLSTPARIRNAAIRRFAADGIGDTSLKSIAADADVSPQLIVHHFGSKDELRVACDQHVAQVIRRRKQDAFAAGPGFDVMATLRDLDDDLPLTRYLARSLSDGSEHVAALVDQMVDDAVAYLADGEVTGVITPSDNPRQRAVVLVVWHLGALVLHEHVERLLGADLTEGTQGALAWGLPAAEILARGVITDDWYEQWREAADALAADQHHTGL